VLENAAEKTERTEKKKKGGTSKTRTKNSPERKRNEKLSPYELARIQSIAFCESKNLIAYSERNRSLKSFLDSLPKEPAEIEPPPDAGQ
jgi:hypothetical protein